MSSRKRLVLEDAITPGEAVAGLLVYELSNPRFVNVGRGTNPKMIEDAKKRALDITNPDILNALSKFEVEFADYIDKRFKDARGEEYQDLIECGLFICIDLSPDAILHNFAISAGLPARNDYWSW